MPLSGILPLSGFSQTGDFFLKINFNLIYLFRLNDIFLQITYKLIETALESGNEDTMINILFKSNLVGSLYNAYDEFTKNEVTDRTQNIDSFLYFSKKIVKAISDFNKVHFKKIV